MCQGGHPSFAESSGFFKVGSRVKGSNTFLPDCDPLPVPIMVDHVRIIAILNFVWAAVTFSVGVQFFVLVDAAPTWIKIVAAVLIVMAIPATIAGIGLLKRRRWGRTFAFVTAALSMISIPIGTAFGIYTFMVLKKPEIAATIN